MAGIQIADAKAPWIMFERRAVEDRAASVESGHYVAKDVDFVLVTPHGSRDQYESEVQDWLERQSQQVQEGRLPQDWLFAWQRSYDNWKAGKEIPVEGTPIINWPVASPAQIRMLQDARVLTVEVLAGANEEVIKRLGMGGRALVAKAKDWLEQAKGTGKVVEELAAMRAEMEALKQRNKDLEERQVALKQAPQAAEASPPAAPPEAINAADLIDPPASARRKL